MTPHDGPEEPDDNGTAFSHIDIFIPEGGGAGAEYRVVSPGKISRENLLLKFTRQTEVVVK